MLVQHCQNISAILDLETPRLLQLLSYTFKLQLDMARLWKPNLKGFVGSGVVCKP